MNMFKQNVSVTSLKISIIALLLLVLGLGSALGSTVPGVILYSPEFPPESDPADCNHLLSAYAAPGLFGMFSDGLYTVIVSDPIFKCFQSVIRFPMGPNSEQQFFNGTFEASVDVIPLGQGTVTLSGPVVTTTMGGLPSKDGYFSAQIESLELFGIVQGMPLMMRQSPYMSSTGMTSVFDLGAGLYAVDSFFDVFAEISIDGGQTWMGSQMPAHMVLTSTSDVLPLDTDTTWSEIKSVYR